MSDKESVLRLQDTNTFGPDDFEGLRKLCASWLAQDSAIASVLRYCNHCEKHGGMPTTVTIRHLLNNPVDSQ